MVMQIEDRALQKSKYETLLRESTAMDDSYCTFCSSERCVEHKIIDIDNVFLIFTIT